MILRFTVPGPPVPKERARIVLKNKKARGVTPDRTRAYERDVGKTALAARCKTNGWPWQNTSVVYYVKITIYRSVARGDWDNFAKAITDACNGILWPDDRQIVHATVAIRKCDKGNECADVEVGVNVGG